MRCHVCKKEAIAAKIDGRFGWYCPYCHDEAKEPTLPLDLPARPAPREWEECFQFFRRVSAREDDIPELKLLFHIPNGEIRDARTGSKLKQMGVRRGVPDYFLPVARGGWHGLFLEMKRADFGNRTAPQSEYCQHLKDYRYEICRGADEAWNKLMDYLSLPEERDDQEKTG